MDDPATQPSKPPSDPASWDDRLPDPARPIGSYLPAVQSGGLLYTSGVLPVADGVVICTGSVGGIAVSTQRANEAARLCALNALAIIKAQLGSLAHVRRIVKLTGFVSSAQGFYEQPAVINGASDLLVEIFGEAGRHARAAVGVYSLPKNASVELEMVVEIA